jgi:hypothetical protein
MRPALEGGSDGAFVVVLALAVAASTQAMAFGPLHQRDARMTRKAEVNEGCGASHHRGSGGACVLNPTEGPYRPDPYWTPCDYSLSPINPRAVPISNGADRSRRLVFQVGYQQGDQEYRVTGAKGDALELIRSLKEQYPDETEDQLISRFPRARLGPR